MKANGSRGWLHRAVQGNLLPMVLIISLLGLCIRSSAAHKAGHSSLYLDRKPDPTSGCQRHCVGIQEVHDKTPCVTLGKPLNPFGKRIQAAVLSALSTPSPLSLPCSEFSFVALRHPVNLGGSVAFGGAAPDFHDSKRVGNVTLLFNAQLVLSFNARTKCKVIHHTRFHDTPAGY